MATGRKASRAGQSVLTLSTNATSVVRTSASKSATKLSLPSIWLSLWTATLPARATSRASPSSRARSARKSSTASACRPRAFPPFSSCWPCASSSPSWSPLSSAITDSCKRLTGKAAPARLTLTWTSWARSSLRPSPSATGAPSISSEIPASPLWRPSLNSVTPT